MTLRIKEEVLRLDVTMCDTLVVEVLNPSENLPETTFHLRWGHATSLDRSIEITARAELHDFAPMQSLVLNEVHGLDDVDVMERRRDAELRRELLDVFFLSLIFPPFPELLQSQLRQRLGTLVRTGKCIP